MKPKKRVTADLSVSLALSHLSDLCHSGRCIPKRILRDFIHGERTDVTINPDGYTCPIDFFIDYQSVSFLKKLILPGNENTRDPAVKKFLLTEEICEETNVRILNLLRSSDHHTWVMLDKARAWIHSVLGSFSWDDAVSFSAFGPGASIGVKRRDAHRIKKIGHKRPTVTRECLALAKAYRAFDQPFSAVTGELTEVIGSEIATVPKNAKTDRIIAIEPLLNMFFQKGIGGLIRHKLRRTGLDLDTQADRNRALARCGSIDGRLATVDLSSASDLISLELVRYLLPEDWFNGMNLCRSHFFFVDGSWSRYRKFSSMGNGFTFELESLIFLALARVSSPDKRINVDIATFGDDIIIPTSAVRDLYGLLGFCGFLINTEKSFTSGPFRESCGSHWFKGTDVTPFYLQTVKQSPHDLYWYCNSIRRLAARLTNGVYCSSLVKGSYDLAVGKIPGRLRRCLIPDGVGDDGLMSSFDEAVPSLRRPRTDVQSWDGFWYLAFARSPKSISHESSAALVSSCWLMRHVRQNGDVLELSRLEAVGFTLRTQTRFLPGRQWPHVGPWC